MTLTVVIVPARGVVGGCHVVSGTIILICGRRISRERIRAVPLWYDGLRGPDGRDDGTVRVEKPDVRTVLITDPESPIVVDDQALTIYGDMLGSSSVGGVRPEAISSVCCGG